MSEQKEEKEKFKVGDRVRVKYNGIYTDVRYVGRHGTITFVDTSFFAPYLVKFDDGSTVSFLDTEMQLAEELLVNSKGEINYSPVGTGVKFDESKPDLTDIPKDAMWEMGLAFTYGQKKYGKSNFRKGMKVSRQIAAAIRHIYQHLDGETIDPEGSNAMHLGHAMASLAMAIYTIKNHPDHDDRFDGDMKRYDTGDSNVK